MARSSSTPEQPLAAAFLLPVLRAQPREDGLDAELDRRQRFHLRRQVPHRRDDQPVVVVGEDHVLLGREVPEERALRDLRRLGDLVDRGRRVPLLLEQAHAVRHRERPEAEEQADPRSVPLDRPPVLLEQAQLSRRHVDLCCHELHGLVA
jgi:hypothetical protein